MSGYGTDALQFLIGTVITLYAVVIILRFLLQAVRADYYNPVTQFIVKASRPVLRPPRRVLPPVGRYDFAALLVTGLLMGLKLALFRLLSIPVVIVGGYAIGIEHIWLGGLAWVAVVEVIALFLNVWLFAILIHVVLSWIGPGGYNPAAEVIARITDPLLRPVRGVVPLLGGIDLSPLVVLIGLQLIKMLLLPPLLAFA